MVMETIRVGGVPEHFNLPWHLAMESGRFADIGVHVDWTTFAGGTGQMCQALQNGDIDICVLLTEGIIKAMINGLDAKIISQYIDSPLIWGVHTAAANSLKSYDQVFEHRIAISRFGSGSHLMPQVDAKSKDVSIGDDQYVVIKNLEGAIRSLTALESDVFYWEKYTTKPLVDRGVLRRLGEFLTPWPCFVLAATDDVIARKPEAVSRMLKAIQSESIEFMKSPTAIDQVAERYEQRATDVARWYHSTEWSEDSWVSDRMLDNVVYALRDTGIVDSRSVIPELVWKR